MNHQIIRDLKTLETFLDFLPEPGPNETYYMSLMARSKGSSNALPPVKDGQVYSTKRLANRKQDIIPILRSYEVPVGCYTRKGVTIQDEHLAPYITINPRCKQKALKEMTLKCVERSIEGQYIDPVDLAMRSIHKSIGEKNFFDFDFDFSLTDNIYSVIVSAFPKHAIIITKGGFHLIVSKESIASCDKTKFRELRDMADQTGSAGMIPIPGCIQRGFCPLFVSKS